MSVIKTFQLLREDEKRQFGLFLASPIFYERISNHKPEALSRFYAYLLSVDGAGEWDKMAAIDYVYEGKAVSVSTFNSLSSALHRLLRQYLTLKPVLEKEGDDPQLSLASLFRERGAIPLFLKTLESLREIQEAKPLSKRDVEYYLENYLLDLETCYFKSAYNTRTGDIHLREMLRSLDIFYMLAKLEYATNLWNQQHMAAIEEEEILPVMEILPAIVKSNVGDIPLIRCFRKAAEMMRYPEEGERHFVEFRAMLEKYAADIPWIQLKTLHTYERNFCTRQYAAGNTNYLPVLFDMYRQQLDQGILYEQDGITQSLLQNIVRVAIKLRETAWAEAFLDAHRDRIVFSQRPQEVYHLLKANIAFEQKDYAATLHYIGQSYEDNYYILDANLLELKLYFERRQITHLLNKLNSFKVNIFKKSKQWLPPQRHLAINRFIDILRQMAHDKILMDRQPRALDKLYQKIVQYDFIAEREWLKDTLEELKTRSQSGV